MYLFSGPDLIEKIKSIVVTLVQKLSLRTTGGDLLRQAVTSYIEHCSKAKFPCHGQDIVDLWKSILGEKFLNLNSFPEYIFI